jgi:hypothetical protein
MLLPDLDDSELFSNLCHATSKNQKGGNNWVHLLHW